MTRRIKELKAKEAQKMSHKFFKTGYPYANQRTRKSKKEETDYGDDVPLISQRGYAISLADAAVKVKKAQKALDEARKKCVL